MAWTALPPAEWLETEPEIIAASQYLQSSTPTTGLGFDTETTGLDIVRDRAILFSMSDGYRRFAAYAEPWLFHPAIRDALLNNPNIIKILTNAKFDRHMIANLGIPMVGPYHDTTVMDWLFNENRQGRHGLKETGRDYCSLQMVPFKDIFDPRRARKGCKVSKKNPQGIPAALAETAGEAIHRTMADPEGRLRAINYSGLDAFASVQVYNYLKARLQEIKMFPGEGRTLWDYFLAYEVPFTDVLWRLERRGFMIHTGHLLDQRGPMEEALRDIELRLAQWAQWPVNPNSPKQLQKLFFDQLQIKPTKMTSGGKSGNKQPSTDDEVLQKFVGEAHPIAGPFAELILKHRGIAKIYGTYVEGLLGRVDTELRMHSTLNQHGTVTGRISSSDPNLQNIPRPKTDRFKIRKAFAAPPGRILVVSDYDQLEMKLMAHFSQDQKMIGAINNGMDLHCYTVHLMFGQRYEDAIGAKKAEKKKAEVPMTPEQEQLMLMRQSAKAVGFGLIYGAGANKIGHQLTEELKRLVDRKEAQGLIQRYFAAFPGVKEFIDNTKEYCHRHEYVQTFLGRFRRLPEINAGGTRKRFGQGDDEEQGNAGTAAMAERQSVNVIIQGTAADIAKTAMLIAEYDGIMDSLDARLLLQVHDELIWECPDEPEIIKQVEERAQQIMQSPFEPYPFSIPLTCEAHHGYTWESAK